MHFWNRKKEHSCKISQQLEELKRNGKNQLSINIDLRARNKDLSYKIKSLKDSDMENTLAYMHQLICWSEY